MTLAQCRLLTVAVAPALAVVMVGTAVATEALLEAAVRFAGTVLPA